MVSNRHSAIESNNAFTAKVEDLVREIVIQNNILYYRIESSVEHIAHAGAEDNFMPVIRVITYFEDTVSQIADLLNTEFEIVAESAVDKKKSRIESFSYKHIQYLVGLKANRKELTEYKRSGDKKFEIQICSMLQDAWAGIEKELGYDSASFPEEGKRDLYRVGALLEMADIEFLKIRSKFITQPAAQEQVPTRWEEIVAAPAPQAAPLSMPEAAHPAAPAQPAYEAPIAEPVYNIPAMHQEAAPQPAQAPATPEYIAPAPAAPQPEYMAPPAAPAPVAAPPQHAPAAHSTPPVPPVEVPQPQYAAPAAEPVYNMPAMQQPAPAQPAAPIQEPVAAAPVAPAPAAAVPEYTAPTPTPAPIGLAPRPTRIAETIAPIAAAVAAVTAMPVIEQVFATPAPAVAAQVQNFVTEKLPEQAATMAPAMPAPIAAAMQQVNNVMAAAPVEMPEAPAPVAQHLSDMQHHAADAAEHLKVTAAGTIEHGEESTDDSMPFFEDLLEEDKNRTVKPAPLDENAPITDSSLKEYVLKSKILKDIDRQIAERAGAKINGDIDIEGDVERLRFLKVYTLKQLHDRLKDNNNDIVAFAEKWIGKDNGGSFDSGISLFYLEYLLVGKRNDPAFAVEYVVKFISDNDYSARYIIPTYNSIRNTEAPNFSHLTLK